MAKAIFCTAAGIFVGAGALYVALTYGPAVVTDVIEYYDTMATAVTTLVAEDVTTGG